MWRLGTWDILVTLHMGLPYRNISGDHLDMPSDNGHLKGQTEVIIK